MLFLTRLFGVTASDAERDLAREQSDIEEIVAKVLVMQANAAAQQHRPLCRGTHAKGTCVRAKFEVFDLAVSHDGGLAARLGSDFSQSSDITTLTLSDGVSGRPRPRSSAPSSKPTCWGR